MQIHSREQQPSQEQNFKLENEEGRDTLLPILHRPITNKEMIGVEGGIFLIVLLLLFSKKSSR